MKNIATVIALTSAIFAGTASAAVESSQNSHFGTGVEFASTSHFEGLEQVVVDSSNLKGGSAVDPVYGVDLYIGSN